MMRRTILAVVLSLAAHGLLALALVVYLEHAPRPDALATLDLSSVELSFAETVEETAEIAPLPPVAPPEPPRPKAVSPPPELAMARRTLPPDPANPKFREPTEEPHRLEVKQPDAPENRTAEPLPAAPRQARLDAPPRPKRNIRPDYPKGARQRGEQGDVTLELRVDAEGGVADVRVVASCGFAELDAAAAKAAKAARFTPARSGPDAVASTARLTLSFRLK